MKKLLIAGIALFASPDISAQLPSTLDTVVISGNRIKTTLEKQNRNIQVIGKEQIKNLPVRSVNELLSYAAGADMRQRGPFGVQGDIAIDGSTFDQVLVLINGVKMSDPQTGHHTLNVPIPLSAIDHIEIIRGPAAHKYGVNALAGVINIVTRIPVQNEIAAQVYAGSSMEQDSATGDTYYNYGAQASAAWTGKGQAHILSLAHDEGNGYRYNTAYNSNRLFYQNHITLNAKNSIEATGGYIANAFGANGYYSAPGDANSTETVHTALGSIAYSYKPTQKLAITPRVSYRYNSDDYIYIKQKPAVYHNFHETNVWTAEIQSSLQLKKGIAGAGIEYRSDDIRSTNLGKRDRSNTGIYAEYKHNFSEKLNAGAGVYANHNSDYGWQLFPGFDAGYRITNKLKLFANAAAGQRLPTYTDLFYKGPANIGNATLQPEYAQYAEGGVQYNNPVLFAQAVYFYRQVTDFIDWVRETNTAPWQPRNFQDINTTGISLQAKYEWSRHLGLQGFHSLLTASYTYLNPEIKAPGNEISKYAIEALRHQAVISMRNVIAGKLFINLTGRYQYRINANDYTLLDARVAYGWPRFEVYADVNNLLDTEYKEIGTVPLPGRWVTAGLKMNLVANK
jgi:iron complex outermembrane receptor protein